MANREACELYIEQEVKSALHEGKNPTAIGKELAQWIEKLFETKIPPETIRSRARKVQNEVTGKVTSQKSKTPDSKGSTKKFDSGRGGKRDGAGRPSEPKFNPTNDNIEWAKWTWNPVTGCKHDCKYCYARDIANRFFKEKFEPTFHEDRLRAPEFTKIPKGQENKPGINNVFVCSMADLFGEWVPDKWIKKVLTACKKSGQWIYIFLTKNPERYENIKFPDNAWVGATADTQARYDEAVKAFSEMKHKPTRAFLSFEPLQEKILTGDGLENFNWIIIGGRSKSTGMHGGQPEWEWVEHIFASARNAGCAVYFKPNLTVRPKEYPDNALTLLLSLPKWTMKEVDGVFKPYIRKFPPRKFHPEWAEDYKPEPDPEPDKPKRTRRTKKQ